MSSSKITITFPDGKKKEYNKGITPLEIAKEIKKENEAIVAKIGEHFFDLTSPINEDSDFKIITFEDSEGRKVFWHSTGHILAHAMKNLFPDVKLGIGPAIEEGFYYDFDIEKTLTPDELAKIEKEMEKIVKQDIKFERIEFSKKDAKKKNDELKEPYRNEILDEIKDEKIPFYKQGEFIDMCIGPHVISTGKIKAFKLLKVSGAYWRGKSENKQLQRIYGISFPSEKQLKDYLHLKEEAEKRDHRKLGKELDLFSIHDEGPGFPFWHPKGMVIKNELVDFWRKEHRKRGYVEIQTPTILSKELWEKSGHWANYRENMYLTNIDGKDYAIKPMNCPGGFLLYNEKVHSYKELPLRAGELGLVHRHELSGVLAGLFRVRYFTQDDAHIFMMPSQIKDEIIGVIDLIDYFYNQIFGFEYHVELSTRPEKSIGTDEQWEMAEKALKEALDAKGTKYKINEGDGAFYGPKIDFHIKDCIGRTWQCGTIQLDMAMPERFDLNYVAEDGKKHRVVMIHRVVYGSIERFIGILIEHYAGKFPLWLAPLQAKILTVADRFEPYAREIKELFDKNNLRVEIDSRSESVPYKVREAQMQKIPLILTVGEKETNSKTVAVRTVDNKVYFDVNVNNFLNKVLENIIGKKQKFEI